MTTVPDSVNSPVEFLYRLRDASGELLYVGITRDWPTRMTQHQREKPWWSDVSAVELVRVLGTRQQIEAIEKAVIKSERPTYNKTHNEVRRTLTVPAATEPIIPHGATDDTIRLHELFTGEPYGTCTTNYVIGDEVDHRTFGRGIILEVRGEGDRAEVTARFDSVGTKHLTTPWAPMRLRSPW
jgi:predicted GIY-YIG superfamily endonuclease